MSELKDYICAVPFHAIEMHTPERFLCCASWLEKFLPNDTPIDQAWYSKEADDIRDSILDGSYRHCNSVNCPYLSQIVNNGNPSPNSPIAHKDNLKPNIQSRVNMYKEGRLPGPSMVQFSFDHSCNLKCPSCRVDMKMSSAAQIKKSNEQIQEIKNRFSQSIQNLYITGTGDPFVAVAFRNFLREFNKKEWPALKNIHLHTNATRWTEEMWGTMPNVHDYVRSCEISIDAATKHTYENKTRLNGDWDQLVANLKFINTIPKLYSVKTSFVVQQANYKEIPLFIELIESIFTDKTKKLKIFFGRITNWGTFSEQEFLQHDIYNEDHPEHQEFLNTISKIGPNPNVFHNFHEYLERPKVVAI